MSLNYFSDTGNSIVNPNTLKIQFLRPCILPLALRCNLSGALPAGAKVRA